MSTELVAVQTAVAEFDKVAAGIAALQEKYGSVVYDVRTTRGMDDAKSARAAVREPRYAIEQVRKAAKAPILALGRQLDARAAEITAAILKIETPIDEQIKAEDARKEAERQAKIDAEQQRIADLQERVDELSGCQTLTPASGSDLIARHIADLERIPVDASFQEFEERATEVKSAGLVRLSELHVAALNHEAAQETLRQERIELDRLRAEQTAREATERQRLAEEARKQQEIAAAEQRERNARIAKEEAERKERQDKEDTERQARIDAENSEIAARKAELDRQEREAREAEAEREDAARKAAIPPLPPPAAVNRPSDGDIAYAVASEFAVDVSIADGWLRTYGYINDRMAAA